MTTDVLASGLTVNDKALKGRSGNLMDARTIGGRRSDIQFLPGIGGAKSGGAAPSVVIQQKISEYGAIIGTGKDLDFAIDGEGMLMVKKNGALYMTTVASFGYEESTRTLMNAAGGALQVVELVDGKLPQNYNSINSLVAASFRNISSSAQATEKIVVAANLDAGAQKMAGPGGVINYTIAGAAQENIKTDIITPGENAQGSVYIGDTLSLLSRVPNTADATTASQFRFGGIAISKKLTASNPIYNATESGADFNIAAGASTGSTQLSLGQGIRITVGGARYEYLASPDGNKEANKQFNSLFSLCKSINETAGGQIRATIGTDDRLYIAAKDADSSITFEDIAAPGGWAGMVDALGLVNVTVNDPVQSRYTRYATNLELSTKVNEVPTLSARFEGDNLRFGSAGASSTLTVNGTSDRIRHFQRVTSGHQPTGTATDSILRRTVSITAPAHGLKVGDWVRINGAGALVGPVGAPVANALQNGVYRVDFVTNDTFAVATRADLVAHGAGLLGINAPPAVGTSMMAPLAAGADPTCTWQKIEGNPTPRSHANTTVGRTATAITAGGIGEIIIDFTDGGITAQSNIAAGTTVYISGSTLLNDGYYPVSVVLGNTVTVLAMCGNNVAGGVAQPPEVGLTLQAATAAAAAVVGVVNADLKMTAVAGVAGGVNINTSPLTLGAQGTKEVTIAVPQNGHSYAIGDVIMFRSLASTNVEYQGIRITQDKAYIIKSKTATTITFDADEVAATVGIGAGGVGHFIGYEATYTAAGVVVAAAAAGLPSNCLGTTARIDYLGAQFKGLGISTNTDFFSTALEITYSGGNPTKNCSSGAVKADYTLNTHIFDTFGRQYPLNIYFKHMSQTVVAVEIAFPQNDQGGYDVTGTPAGTGLIAFGNMTFDKNGHLLQNPSLKEINVRWSNGSNSTKIIMDWGPENGFDLNQKPSTHYGLTKLAGPNHEKFIEPDGNAPGSVIGYQYSKSGVITAVFSNGYTRDIYQVLIGAVSNYDGLDHKGGGLYVAMPSRSGQISLQIAGTAGVGSFISGALQGSAISASAEILDSTGIANLAKMLYHQVSTQKSIDDYALQRV